MSTHLATLSDSASGRARAPLPSSIDADLPTPRIRVAIADDHAVVRTGYRRLLELDADVEVVAEFGNGESAYRWLSDHAADILILDLAMPGAGGLATLARLRQRLPDLRVLVFTMHESADLAAQALRAGAGGYVTKSSPPESLVAAVRELAAGATPVSADLARALARPAREAKPLHLDLSPREFAIFRMLADGRGIEEIAISLSLSVKTVANHRTAIRQKTGLANALEMYRYCETHALIATEGEAL